MGKKDEENSYKVHTVLFSPDGANFLIGWKKTIQLWVKNTRKIDTTKFEGHGVVSHAKKT